MEGMERENRSNQIDPVKRKYMRFMEVGFAFWLAILPGMILAEMYGLYQLEAMLPVFLLMLGAIIFAVGYYGWQGLKERRRLEGQKPNDCPK